MHKFAPKAKIIVLLRDPADRLFSQFNMMDLSREARQTETATRILERFDGMIKVGVVCLFVRSCVRSFVRSLGCSFVRSVGRSVPLCHVGGCVGAWLAIGVCVCRVRTRWSIHWSLKPTEAVCCPPLQALQFVVHVFYAHGSRSLTG